MLKRINLKTISISDSLKMDLSPSPFWIKSKKQQTLVFDFNNVSNGLYDDDDGETSEVSIGNKQNKQKLFTVSCDLRVLMYNCRYLWAYKKILPRQHFMKNSSDNEFEASRVNDIICVSQNCRESCSQAEVSS